MDREAQDSSCLEQRIDHDHQHQEDSESESSLTSEMVVDSRKTIENQVQIGSKDQNQKEISQNQNREIEINPSHLDQEQIQSQKVGIKQILRKDGIGLEKNRSSSKSNGIHHSEKKPKSQKKPGSKLKSDLRTKSQGNGMDKIPLIDVGTTRSHLSITAKKVIGLHLRCCLSEMDLVFSTLDLESLDSFHQNKD